MPDFSRFLLSHEQRNRFGVEPGWNFGVLTRVRWSDLDAYGHANHRSHLAWFEDARNDYLESAGFPLRNANHAGPVLRAITCEYEKPVELNQELLITAKTNWIGRTSFEMSYALWRDGLVARGNAVCIWHVNETHASVPLPDGLRSFMKALDAPANRAAIDKARSQA